MVPEDFDPRKNYIVGKREGGRVKYSSTLDSTGDGWICYFGFQGLPPDEGGNQGAYRIWQEHPFFARQVDEWNRKGWEIIEEA